jgi:hypothetical protein
MPKRLRQPRTYRARRSGATCRACVGQPRVAAYGSTSPGAFVSMRNDGGTPPHHYCLFLEIDRVTTAERLVGA